MCGFQIIYPKGPTWLFLLERFESEIKDSYSAIKFANFGGVVELEGLHCVQFIHEPVTGSVVSGSVRGLLIYFAWIHWGL